MSPYTQVGKYILKKRIGEGAFAEVRLAVHQETREEYAVKVFDRSNVPQSRFERDIKKEIKIMQHLRHPNIVEIHAVLVTDKKLYLVMELVRGGELYDEIVKKRRVDEGTSRRYFQQIVDAMVYCHRRGVVHRDLKPENLLLDGNGNVKITDFGMSWMKDNIDPAVKAKQLLRTQCGTPKYMPPEIIKRPPEGYDGEKLDAWECGMVLYALLAGYLPFAGEDDNSVFRSILNGQVRFPRHFSPGAKDLLSRLLVKDPSQRSSLAEIRQHFWFLVNYHGDSVTERKKALKLASLGPLDSNDAENEEDADKENRVPLHSISSKHSSEVPSPAVASKTSAPLRERRGSQNMAPATRGSGTSTNMKARSSIPSPLAQAAVITKHTSSEASRISNVPTKTNLEMEDQSISGTEPSGKTLLEVVCHTPSRAPPAAVSTPRNSPRPREAQLSVQSSLATPRKSPPLPQRLSNMLADNANGEKSPMSLRDRLRSPLANVLKSLRSGTTTGSENREGGSESREKLGQEGHDNGATWFEPSPTSVAATGVSRLQLRAKNFSRSLSSSDEDLMGPVDNFMDRGGAPATPSTLRKMANNFRSRR